MNNIDKLGAALVEKPDAAQAIAAEFGNPDKVKAALLRFAGENGISLTEVELAQAMAESQAGADGTLSEAELARVAGGQVVDAVIYSIFTLGIGCAVMSADAAQAGKDCGKELRDIEFPSARRVPVEE